MASVVYRFKYLLLGLYLLSMTPHLGLLEAVGIDLSGTQLKTMYGATLLAGFALMIVRRLVRLVIVSLVLFGGYLLYTAMQGPL